MTSAIVLLPPSLSLPCECQPVALGGPDRRLARPPGPW